MLTIHPAWRRLSHAARLRLPAFAPGWRARPRIDNQSYQLLSVRDVPWAISAYLGIDRLETPI
jgi:hypothetical protein